LVLRAAEYRSAQARLPSQAPQRIAVNLERNIMRMQHLSTTLQTAHAINRPLMIWGAPGGGKSSAVHQYAARAGLPVLDWRLTMMDAVDMRGTPKERNGMTHWAPPAELPHDQNSKGILFIDELAQARVEVKNVAAMLTLERRIGEYRLPPGWWICSASNRLGDAAGTSPMPTHLNNRFWHVDLEINLDDWLVWADAADIDYRTIAYLRYRPSALMSFDPRSKEAAFASPRSWHLSSDMLKSLDAAGLLKEDPTLVGEWFAGAVGKAYGHEFVGFLRTMASLVTLDQIFLDPENAQVSGDPSVSYALATALAMSVDRNKIEAAFTYLRRIGKEFAFVFAKKVENAQPALRKTKAFVTFCALHADYI